MRKRIFLSLIIVLTSLVSLQTKVKADYWLVIGSYRQGSGGKPQVSGITSPSLFAIPIGTEKMCLEAGKKIENDIYKPVWQFDSKWTCIKNQRKININ
tara:strand:- start:757 stop:1050 length:294 start_codon:yes stop_codon:yes gene_type:complete